MASRGAFSTQTRSKADLKAAAATQRKKVSHTKNSDGSITMLLPCELYHPKFVRDELRATFDGDASFHQLYFEIAITAPRLLLREEIRRCRKAPRAGISDDDMALLHAQQQFEEKDFPETLEDSRNFLRNSGGKGGKGGVRLEPQYHDEYQKLMAELTMPIPTRQTSVSRHETPALPSPRLLGEPSIPESPGRVQKSSHPRRPTMMQG